MGDPTGADTLVEAVKARQWDKGWKYTGMGQYGPSMSALDSLIIALGRTRRGEALEPILAKVRQLGPDDALSHHRAVAMALETLANPSAAKALAELLQKPGMAGHAYPDLDVATRSIPRQPRGQLDARVLAARVDLARALYRCGDYEGLGEKTLRRVRPGPARPLRPPRPGDLEGETESKVNRTRTTWSRLMSLRAQRSNLSPYGLRLLRRCTPRNDMIGHRYRHGISRQGCQ